MSTQPQRPLRGIAAEVNRHKLHHGGDLVAIGQLLIEARKTIKTSQRLTFGFTEWLVANVEKSQSFCYRAMKCYRALRKLPQDTLARLAPSAARLMAYSGLAKQPKIVEQINQLAAIETGRLTATQLERLFDIQPASQGRKRPTEKQLAQLTIERLERTLEHSTVMSLYRDDHDEDDPLSRHYRCTIVGDPGTVTRTYSAESLAQLLAKVTGEEEMKRCPKCKQHKPLDMFNKACSYCKMCDRARIAIYDRAQREKSQRAKKS